jgi:hypothetical protein
MSTLKFSTGETPLTITFRLTKVGGNAQAEENGASVLSRREWKETRKEMTGSFDFKEGIHIKKLTLSIL